MRIVIFGATGPTGRHLVRLALAAGHDVTVFVRNPEPLSDVSRDLTIFVGDVRDANAVERAVAGQDAVLSALGPRKRSKSAETPKDIVSLGTRNIIRAMAQHGVRRFVCLSSVGVGDSRGRLQAGLLLGLIFERILVPFILKNEFIDKERTENLVAASELDWILVRPTKLVDAPARGDYRIAVDGRRVARLYSTISRADVAAFMLSQATVNEYVRRAPVIGC